MRSGLLSRLRTLPLGRLGFGASRMTAARRMVVPSVHEPMQQRTREQQEPRQRAQEVGSVLLPQEEQRNRGEGRKSPTQPLVIDRAVVSRLGQLVTFHATTDCTEDATGTPAARRWIRRPIAHFLPIRRRRAQWLRLGSLLCGPAPHLGVVSGLHRCPGRRTAMIQTSNIQMGQMTTASARRRVRP